MKYVILVPDGMSGVRCVLVFFLIGPLLAPRRLPGADQADRTPAVRMDHDDQPLLMRQAHRNPPLFECRVQRVRDRH